MVRKQELPHIVSTARKFLGTNYNWEGRLTKRFPGLDCLGLLFKTMEKNYGVPWKTWNTNPAALISQIGKKNKSMFLKSKINVYSINRLKLGDFLFFLWDDKNIWPAILQGQKKYWVWHAAIYSGNNNIIHASPFNRN